MFVLKFCRDNTLTYGVAAGSYFTAHAHMTREKKSFMIRPFVYGTFNKYIRLYDNGQIEFKQRGGLGVKYLRF